MDATPWISVVYRPRTISAIKPPTIGRNSDQCKPRTAVHAEGWMRMKKDDNASLSVPSHNKTDVQQFLGPILTYIQVSYLTDVSSICPISRRRRLPLVLVLRL